MSVEGSQDVIRAITAVQQDIKHMSKQLDKVTEISEKAIRNEEATKSAHKRIDDVESSLEVIRTDQKWVWRAIAGGFISIMGSVITFFITRLF